MAAFLEQLNTEKDAWLIYIFFCLILCIFSKDYFELLKDEYEEYRELDRSKNKALEIEGKKLMFISSEDPLKSI